VALLEAIDITSTDGKMLMEELLNNTAWSSTGVLEMDSSEVFLAMYGSASLVLISTVYSTISSILSCFARRRRSTRSPTWSAGRGGQVALATILLLPTSPFPYYWCASRLACCVCVWARRKARGCDH
jgi:hypothetical protein